MALLAERVRDMRSRLPRAFATLVPGNFEIKRMAPEVEPGAPGAYGGPGTIDGRVPGKFWINLRNMSVWTTYNVPTLVYHESIPGHVWQGEHTFKMPLLRSLLVVDTGLHAKRWTREQAIRWFAGTNGSSVDEVTSEVDRYCAWPGQACGYKVGHSEINRLRAQAQHALGEKFDFRHFNDAVVKTGGVPMIVLARAVDAFIARQR